MKLLKLQYNEFNINLYIIKVNGLQRECRVPMSHIDHINLASTRRHCIISKSHDVLQEIQICCTTHLT